MLKERREEKDVRADRWIGESMVSLVHSFLSALTCFRLTINESELADRYRESIKGLVRTTVRSYLLLAFLLLSGLFLLSAQGC